MLSWIFRGGEIRVETEVRLKFLGRGFRAAAPDEDEGAELMIYRTIASLTKLALRIDQVGGQEGQAIGEIKVGRRALHRSGRVE